MCSCPAAVSGSPARTRSVARRTPTTHCLLSPPSTPFTLNDLFSFHLLISNKGPYGLSQVAYSDIHRHTDNIQYFEIKRTLKTSNMMTVRVLIKICVKLSLRYFNYR